MKLLSAMRSLLAILAVVGLALAPVARSAMAMPATAAPPVSDQPMADDAATAMAQEAMPEDMPCCPTQAPVSNCGGDCLFMAVCTTQFLCNAVPGAVLVIPLGLLSVFIPGNDTDTAGLSQGPPPRPPNT